MLIQDLLDALKEKKFIEASRLFAEDGKYIDYCPSQVKKDDWFLYGAGHIEMFLRNRFVMGMFEIFDPIVTDESTGDFYAAYEGVWVPALITIETEDGKIKKAGVRPK